MAGLAKTWRGWSLKKSPSVSEVLDLGGGAFLFKVRGCILRSAAASSQSSSGSNASGDAKRNSADGLRRPFPDTIASCEFWLADIAYSLTAAANGGSCSSS
jgi:hypothetical protein